MTVSAEVRLIPRPPALVDNRNTGIGTTEGSSASAAAAASLNSSMRN